MKRVFISYAREEKLFAERLARDISDAGLDVWIDFRNIPLFTDWEHEIFQAINQCDIILVCLSPNAISSEWVRREILMARSQEKTLMPILFRACIEQLSQYDETRKLLDLQLLDFENRYDQALPELLAAIAQIHRPTGEESDRGNIPCPFKGLEAFQQTDERFFFGREDHLSKMLGRLSNNDARFLAIVGASGSGKSSLVRAGLIPVLRAGQLPGSEGWPIAIFSPGPRPMEALAVRLLPILGSNHLLPEIIRILENDGPRALHQLIEGILSDSPRTRRLVLVIDQFEEVFTRASQSEAGNFLKSIYTAATIEDGRVLVVLTLRADFFDRLGSYPEFAALFERQNMVIVTDMTPENLRASIENPASVVGLVFDEGLPERILDDVREQPGSLPLLEYALKELFEHRQGNCLSLSAYHEMGGVRHALAKHAENLYLSLAPSQRDLMRRILLRLIEVSDTGEPTRRTIARSELTFQGVSDRAVDQVVNRLTAPESRLLVASREINPGADQGDRPAICLEISHEALVREWALFNNWVAENEAELRLSSELHKAAQDWEKNRRDPAYLLTGSRLTRAQAWLEVADASPLQRQFILSGVEARQQLEREERERQEQYANAQRRAARRMLYLAVAVIIVLMVGSLALVALEERGKARDAASLADLGATAAQINANQAATSAAEAQIQATNAANIAITAVSAQNMAWLEADRANTQAANAATSAADARSAQKQAQEQAEFLARSADEMHSLALASDARDALKDTDFSLALALALEANSIEDPPAQAQRILSEAAYQPGARYYVEAHEGAVSSVAISPDGERALSGAEDGSLILWNLQTGTQVRQFAGHSQKITAIAFEPNGHMFVTGANDGSVILWSIVRTVPLRHLGQGTDPILALAFHPEGHTVASTTGTQGITLWEAATGRALRQFKVTAEAAAGLAFSPDGRTLVGGLSDGRLILWDVETGEGLRTFEGLSSQWVTSAVFSPDGRTVASGSCSKPCTSGEQILWDVESGVGIKKQIHSGWAYIIAFDPASQMLFTYSTGNNDIIGWDPENQEMLTRLSHHSSGVGDAALSPDGRHVFSGSCAERDEGNKCVRGELALWDVENGAQFHQSTRRGIGVWTATFSPDGRKYLTGLSDSSLVLWDTQTGNELRYFSGHRNAVWGAAFSPDGGKILSGSCAMPSRITDYSQQPCRRGEIILWDVETGELPKRWEWSNSWVKSVAFVDETTVLLNSLNGELVLWDMETDTTKIHLDGKNAAISPDHTLIAFASGDASGDDQQAQRHLVLWDVETDAELKRLEGHNGTITTLVFSPDGQFILSGSEDKSLILWDTTTGEQLHRLEGHEDRVTRVVFSPDGQFALSTSKDTNLILWDVTTGTELRRFEGHRGEIKSLAIDAAGQLVVSGSSDGTIILWRMDTLDQLKAWVYSNRYVREWSCRERIQYRLEPYCEAEGPVATPTAYPTFPPTSMPEATVATPTLDLTWITLTPTSTITPTRLTWTPMPASTSTPGYEVMTPTLPAVTSTSHLE